MRWPRRLPFQLFLAWCLPASAIAQTSASNVQLNQYQPTPFSDRVLRLDGGAVLPFGQYRLGFDVDYAFRPLVLKDSSPGILPAGASADHHLVEHAVGGSLLASFGLGHRLEAGLAVPLALFQSGDAVAGAASPSALGLGNVRLGLKAHLFERAGAYLGATLVAAVPAGAGTLTHESGLGGEARLLFGYRRGKLALGARVGFRLRSAQHFHDVALGNEWTAAAGGTWKVAPRTNVLLELAGATAASAPFAAARQSPLEALAGIRQRFGKTWFTVAGGPGLVNGYGSPLFRLVAGVTWANVPPDSDGDGIGDDVDRCPEVAEDRDDFQDSDGCPDPDNDGDGIADASDKCPNAPEDRDGFQDADGCPDPDNDGDGILDGADKCPLQPETVNDFEDDDGCPDETPPGSDKDKDGILDDVDECPEEAEDKDGFEDADGCPDLDNDKDGIPDATDKCPLQPETINGIEDDDGCPDKGQTQVRLGKNEIETLQPIYFDTDRSRVRHAFYNILGQIASLMKAHPEIGRCAVEGHTDDTGPPEWNQKLSMLRAAAVIEFLGNKGVDPTRLVPMGHGEQLPWASNETEEGRAKNRRVVFHIEGVNPADEKKQEQRAERRRRIRHRRESQELERAKDQTSKEPASPAVKQGAAPPAKERGREEPAQPTRDAPRESKPLPQPDVKEQKLPEKSLEKPTTGKSRSEGPAPAPAPIRPFPASHPPQAGEREATAPPRPPGAPTPVKSAAPAHSVVPATAPLAAPPAAEKKAAPPPAPAAPTKKLPSAAPPKAAPAAGPASAEAEGPAEPPSDKLQGSKEAGKTTSRPVAPRTAARKAAKPAPDAGAGPPPTLRDLLKLPQR